MSCAHQWAYYSGCLGYESEMCKLCGVDIADLPDKQLEVNDPHGMYACVECGRPTPSEGLCGPCLRFDHIQMEVPDE